MSTVESPLPTVPTQRFRLDVPLHNLLQQPSQNRQQSTGTRKELRLPTPVFPLHPELLHEVDARDIAAHQQVISTGKRHWPASQILRTMRGWMVPYLKSRV